MPQTVNGVGTYYFGKGNRETYYSTCKSCGYSGYLETYDTTLFIVFFYIPLIPLKKLRILDDCPNCRRHYAIKQAAWQKYKTETIVENIAAFNSQAKTTESAKKLLGTLIYYRDKENFLKVVDNIKYNYSKDKEILSIIGYIYMSFGMLTESEQAYKSALALDSNDEGIKECLADIYIINIEPDKAEPYLYHISSKNLTNKVNLLFRLAGAFQAVGNHQKALYILDNCRTIVPGLEKNAEYKKMRKVSEKNMMTNVKIIPKWLKKETAFEQKKSSGSGGASKIPMLIGPVIFLAILGVYLFFSYDKGENREVFVVNGLPKPYTVKINSKEVKLPPLKRIPVKIKEGVINIEPVSGYANLQKENVTIKTPFYSRVFTDDVFIINPDKTAMVLKEKTYYIAKTASMPKNLHDEWKLLSNKALHHFRGIDYKFREFPPEIKVEGDNPKLRTRIEIYGEDGKLSREQMFPAFFSVNEKGEAEKYFKQYLTLEPDDTKPIFYLKGVMKPEDFIQLASQHINIRPLKIDWHRAYQDAMEEINKKTEIEAEYKAMLAKSPDDKQLMYLTGRAYKDYRESNKLWEEAAKEPNPSYESMRALGFYYISNGEFGKAYDYLKNGCALSPEDFDSKSYFIQALVANEKWDECLEFIKANKGSLKSSFIYYEALCVLKTKGMAEAELFIHNYVKTFKHANTDKLVETYSMSYLSNLNYAAGDYKKASEPWLKIKDPYYIMLDALINGNIKQADESIDSEDEPDYYNSILIYTGAEKAGFKEMSDKHLKIIVDQLKEEGGYENVLFSEALKTGTVPDFDYLIHTPVRSEEKKYLLLALAFRFPEHKQECLDLALKLSFTKMSPHQYIEILAGKNSAENSGQK